MRGQRSSTSVHRHTVSTLSRFVVPGTSNGTPAVTTTRSPDRAELASAHGLQRQAHHLVVGVAVRHELGHDAPDERELAVRARLVGEHEDRHARPVRRDDARAESTLREHDQHRARRACATAALLAAAIANSVDIDVSVAARRSSRVPVMRLCSRSRR